MCKTARVWAVLFCVVSMMMGAEARCQASVPSADIYRNIVGDWVGEFASGMYGVLQHSSVEVVISETPKKDAVLMEYTYSTRGKKDFYQWSKWMKLDPVRSVLSFRFKDDVGGGDNYKATGLQDFAQRGVGQFTATGPAPGGNGAEGLFKFELSSNVLRYEWQRKTPDGKFVPITIQCIARNQRQ